HLVHRRQNVRRRADHPSRLWRTPSAHDGERHHDEPSHASTRHVDGARERSGREDSAAAHGDRETRRTPVGAGDRRCAGAVGVPLSRALSHGARDVPGGTRPTPRRAGPQGPSMKRALLPLVLVLVSGGPANADEPAYPEYPAFEPGEAVAADKSIYSLVFVDKLEAAPNNTAVPREP